MVCGVAGFWLIPRDISSCKFLSEEEKHHVHARRFGATGHDEETEPFAWSEIFSVFASLHLWLLAIIAFCSGLAVYSVAYFLPTITSTFGYTYV